MTSRVRGATNRSYSFCCVVAPENTSLYWKVRDLSSTTALTIPELSITSVISHLSWCASAHERGSSPSRNVTSPFPELGLLLPPAGGGGLPGFETALLGLLFASVSQSSSSSSSLRRFSRCSSPGNGLNRTATLNGQITWPAARQASRGTHFVKYVAKYCFQLAQEAGRGQWGMVEKKYWHFSAQMSWWLQAVLTARGREIESRDDEIMYWVGILRLRLYEPVAI